MTTIQIPDWDVHDRVRKAMRKADIGVSELADYMGVNRSTVSTWINGRIVPPTSALRLVAHRCGVPFEWLREGVCAARDSNPEPADSRRISGSSLWRVAA